MKKYIFILLIMIAFKVSGQEYYGGINMGATMFNHSKGYGYEYGLTFEKYLKDYLSIHSTLSCNSTSMSQVFLVSGSNYSFNKQIDLRASYLRLSVQPTLYFKQFKNILKRFNFFVTAGPHIGYLTRARFNESWRVYIAHIPDQDNDGWKDVDNDYKIGFVDSETGNKRDEIYKENVKRFEFGYALGGGFEIKEFFGGVLRTELKWNGNFTTSFNDEALYHISYEWDLKEYKLQWLSLNVMYLFKF